MYGSEADFYITLDNVVVCHHDPTIGGKKINAVNYSEIKDMTLGNGEKIPTFDAYLEQLKADPNMKLIIEIKDHDNSNEKHDRVVNKITEMGERSSRPGYQSKCMDHKFGAGYD